ncbi:uncharacterized protein F5891DRAFT_1199481 [Suillus fuscotomentosus]|uniref:Protein kinase domain-containing protein n=1 Tax=Suillus fuscotomentosus TaxID=1912939 RepID=A0AAD4DPC5_9AGAM|nr:uncharacterized protein F5891DRAFT_1199481 [Suillus fuscotomentosus]KAG1887912.1 hypothetical protein F5891DRAFT_1199481 [Suillus fuscotomentosus]
MSGSGVSDNLPEAPPVEARKHPFEEIFASFFNIVSGAVAREQPMVMKANNAVIRTWSSANATRPVKDEEMQCKPDLALLDDMTARWDTIKAVCELTSQPYSPQSTIGKTIDSKAYLLLRRFVLLLSLTNGYRELRVHMYDHSGGVVTPGINIVSDPNFYLHILSCLVFGNPECLGYDPSILIFTKTLRPAQLEIPSAFSRPMTNKPPTLDQACESLVESPMDEVFQGGSTAPPQIGSAVPTMSNAPASASTTKATVTPDPPPPPPRQKSPQILFGLVGRGTVCYLARRGDEEYIIKDHWVLGDKNVALNEVTMLQAMQGVRGVPQLIEHWLVEIGPQEVDETMSYCGKIWQSIKGTSRTHVQLISAIRDIVKIQQIAVEERGILHRDCSLNNSMIEDDGHGSHGTLIDWEFTVRILTGQKYAIRGTGTAPFMSRSLLFQLSEAVGTPPLIMHGCQDDLESVFYVFIWICIGYRGPLGVKRVLGPRKPSEGDWLLRLWSTDSFKENGNEKTSFFFHLHAHKFREQFHSYFHDLLPLAEEWYELIRSKGPSHSVTFKEVIDLLTKHLNILPKDEPSPELLFARKVIDALPGGLPDALPGGKRKEVSEAVDNDLPVMEHDMAFGGQASTNDAGESQPRCSGRPGAGKGGRGAQLEKIGAILDAPARTSQPKGTTSLNSDFPVNPLAPELPRKGRGTPSSFTTSETLDSNTMVPRPRPKKIKKIVAPSLSLETSNNQPTFVQREVGQRYGFSPPVVPPGTELDLQALNNPFVAAAKAAKEQHVASHNSHLIVADAFKRHPPAAPTNDHLLQQVLSRPVIANLSDDNLDPTLRSINQGDFGPQDTDTEGSDASEEGSDSEDMSDGDDDSTNQQIGWGESRGHHNAHPGFSEEVQPSQPRVAVALPTDFEFQHSRDEDDQAAGTLAFDYASGSDDSETGASQPADVLELHHKKNGHPRLPDPALLAGCPHSPNISPPVWPPIQDAPGVNTLLVTVRANALMDEPGTAMAGGLYAGGVAIVA